MKLFLMILSVLSMIGCAPNNQNKGLLDAKVENVRVVSVTSNTVTLEWEAVDGAEYYGLNLGDSLDVLLKQFDVTTSNISIDSLDPSTKYTIVIGAYPENGPGSAPSDPFAFITLP